MEAKKNKKPTQAEQAYPSAWLGTTTSTKPPGETASVLALAIAVATSKGVALSVMQQFLDNAAYPVPHESSSPKQAPVHPLDGEPMSDYYAAHDDELKSAEAISGQERIVSASVALKKQLASQAHDEVDVWVRPEMPLYRPAYAYIDVGGVSTGSRVDLSICMTLPGGLRLQVLIEAKASTTAGRQKRDVEGWGKNLDQPLRYAAIWEDLRDSDAEPKPPVTRVMGTVATGDYRERWQDLWFEKRGHGQAKSPRVAMAADQTWRTLREIVQLEASTESLARFMKS